MQKTARHKMCTRLPRRVIPYSLQHNPACCSYFHSKCDKIIPRTWGFSTRGLWSDLFNENASTFVGLFLWQPFVPSVYCCISVVLHVHICMQSSSVPTGFAFYSTNSNPYDQWNCIDGDVKLFTSNNKCNRVQQWLQCVVNWWHSFVVLSSAVTPFEGFFLSS